MAPKIALAGAAAAIALVSLFSSTPADARCTRLAFSVNDYGKEGPTRDAKALLDKYIKDWTAQQGIKQYRTGKKEVACELCLDFGFFDEWTCKATASVCWGASLGVRAAPRADAGTVSAIETGSIPEAKPIQTEALEATKD